MMVPLSAFPAINASLNALSGILLLVGYFLIRRRQVEAHRRTMIAACTSSAVFLACYLYYHAHAGVTRFRGVGWVRGLYFSILVSHTVLAVIIVPLILVTLARGLRRRDQAHRRIARITYPLWLYVSVTGVVVYFFLYHWYPSR
jgi:uncharacterized membrane protein YozB (DUF420 family)